MIKSVNNCKLEPLYYIVHAWQHTIFAASVLSKDAVIELLSKFSEEMDHAEVTGDSDIEWPDKVDPPSFEKPGII